MQTVDVTTLTNQSVRSMANQHLGILGMSCSWGWEHILSRQNLPKHSLENVTRLITENCSLVDNSYQYVR